MMHERRQVWPEQRPEDDGGLVYVSHIKTTPEQDTYSSMVEHAVVLPKSAKSSSVPASACRTPSIGVDALMLAMEIKQAINKPASILGAEEGEKDSSTKSSRKKSHGESLTNC